MSDTQYIYGKHPVREALNAERPVLKLYLSKGLREPIQREFQKLAKNQGVSTQLVPSAKLASLLPPEVNHQGLVAEIGAYAYTDFDSWFEGFLKADKPFALVLDKIQDPHNLGAILRSAEAVGVQGVIVPRHGSVGLTDVVAKASAGAIERVPVVQVTNLARCLEAFQQQQIWSMGLSAQGGQSLYQTRFDGGVVLVIGNEHKGLRPNVAKHCDQLIHIPMKAERSLNASVSAAVAMYEVYRQSLG